MEEKGWEAVICATCKAEGQTSTITVGGGMVTSVYYPPYYDEAGVYHSHDANAATFNYACSRGHRWKGAVPPPKCPGCSWPEPAST